MEYSSTKSNTLSFLNGRYEIISHLNHGSFGTVSLAKDTKTRDIVALKSIPKANPTNVVDESDTEELRYHALLGQHPHIVNMYHSFETTSHLHIVLEFCSMGDLYEAIRLNKGPLETEHIRDFMLQLISAVEHMHSCGVYHRDIKPENIFLTPEGDMKLGDFGLATTDELSEEVSVGSDRYMAPEQYDPSMGPYSPAKADIWAIGVCLLNVLFARNPFSIPSEEDPLFSDFLFDRQSLFDIFPTMSAETFDVLSHCLALDPSKRSLAKLRDAVENVRSWTTDDEVFDDDFCTEDRDLVMATTYREPLRTPSIGSAHVNFSGGFPWAQALQTTSQQRQLSTIYDEELSYSIKKFIPHSYDSGLGSSLDSLPPKNTSPFKGVSYFSNSRIEIVPPRSLIFSNNGTEAHMFPASPTFVSNASVKHIPIAGKKPSVYTATSDSAISTSWSDWVDEDEEEEQRERIAQINQRTWSWDSAKDVKTTKKDHSYDHVFEMEELNHDFDDDLDWVTGGYEALRL